MTQAIGRALEALSGDGETSEEAAGVNEVLASVVSEARVGNYA